MSSKFSHRSTRVLHTPSICKSKVRKSIQLPQCATTDTTFAINATDNSFGWLAQLIGTFCVPRDLTPNDYRIVLTAPSGVIYTIVVGINPLPNGVRFSINIVNPGVGMKTWVEDLPQPPPGPGLWTNPADVDDGNGNLIGTWHIRQPLL